MSRLPPRPRNQLTPEEQEVHDKFYNIAERAFGANGEQFIYKEDSNDALIGPFPFYIASPPAGNALHALLSAFAKLPLPADAREVVIMAVGGHFQAGYVTYSHVSQAIATGLSREQVEVLRKGESKPEGLNEKCDTAYDVTQHLLTHKGPLPQRLWDRSIEVLGRDGTVGLLHYAGLYSYVSMALNGMDAPVPE